MPKFERVQSEESIDKYNSRKLILDRNYLNFEYADDDEEVSVDSELPKKQLPRVWSSASKMPLREETPIRK